MPHALKVICKKQNLKDTNCRVFISVLVSAAFNLLKTNSMKKSLFLTLVALSFSVSLLFSKNRPTVHEIDSLLQLSRGVKPVSKEIEMLKEARTLSQKINYMKGYIESNVRVAYRLSPFPAKMKEVEQIIASLDSVYAIHPSDFSNLHLFRYLGTKGVLLKEQYDFSNALIYYLKADSVAKVMENITLQLDIYHLLTLYYYDVDNVKMTLAYSKKLINATKDSLKYSRQYAYTLLNVGLIHIDHEQYDSALFYLNQSIRKSRFPFLRGNQYLALGEAYIMKDEIDSAQKYASIAMPILTGNRDLNGKVNNYNLLGRIELKKENLDQALVNFQKGLALSDSITVLNSKIKLHQNIVRTNLLKSGHDDKILNDLLVLRDSITSVKTKKRDREIAAKYELEKRELKIENLKSENARKKSMIYLIVISSTSLILILLIVFLLRRKILKANLEKKRLENQVLHSELNNSIIQAKNHVDTIKDLKDQIDKSKINRESVDEITELLNQNYIHENCWFKILRSFDQIYDNYTQKIRQKYQSLTKNDIRLLVLIKLDYSNKAIADVKNISEGSVKKAKQRLLAKTKHADFKEII